MGIFHRVTDIISANVNDLVEKFENPERMLRQAIREMEDSIVETLDNAAGVVAAQKILQKDLTRNRGDVEACHTRAREALQEGDEDSARELLRRKCDHEKLVRALEDELDTTRKHAQTLKLQIDAMRVKVAEARRKLSSLASFVRTASATRRFCANERRVRTDGFERHQLLEDRIILEEAKAEALGELQDTLGQDWGVLPSRSSDDLEVERHLKELKDAERSEKG